MTDPVVKEQYGVLQKSGKWVRDEATNAPKQFTTKRDAYLAYGPDADVQPMRVTYERSPAKKPITKRK